MLLSIMAMSPQAYTVTGFERVDGIEYAQSWLGVGAGVAAGDED